jgi:hypothetical protein
MKLLLAWITIGLLGLLSTTVADTQVVGGTIGVKGKPFCAEVVNESTKVMGHGDLVHHESHSRLFRDSEGRVRSESGENGQVQVTIIDPVGRVIIVLDPQIKTATIEDAPAPSTLPAGDQSEKSIPEMAQKKLQDKEIEGFRASGTRYSHSIDMGQSHEALTIVTEIWYSPELQVTLLTSQEESPSNRNLMRLTNIRRGDPAPQLFQVPPDYKVKSTSRQQ